MLPLFDTADVISTYTAEQAVEDGVLVEAGRVGQVPVYITACCMLALDLDDEVRRRDVVERCLTVLRAPDAEDDEYRRLRSLDVDGETVWAILDGQGLTVMLPGDY